MAALNDSITCIKGIGKSKAAYLRRLGIETVGDALYTLPREYKDLGRYIPLRDCVSGEEAIIRAVVTGEGKLNYIRSSMNVFKLPIESEGVAGVCTWYNQPFLQRAFAVGEEYIFYGKCDNKYAQKALVSAQYIKLAQGEKPGILPLYALTQGVSQKSLRAVITECLAQALPLEETLPESFVKKNALMGINEALRAVHTPRSMEEAQGGRDRLMFEELALFLIYLRASRNRHEAGARALSMDAGQRKAFRERLGFAYTGAQERVMGEIAADMAGERPMNRLVQGDVGSGKTALAMEALYIAACSGCQGALMAPTEILAQQHYAEAKRLFEPLGIKCALLVSSLPLMQKRQTLRETATGEIQVVIGTHALIQKGVEYKDLALVVTDEQHRFGVGQRAELQHKGTYPHTLVMSATPVPRTLALLIYADLDLSVVDELPPGRKPVLTRVVPMERQGDMYRFIRKIIDEGAQAYVVCPRIEEGDDGSMSSAQSTFDYLRRTAFSSLEIALVHGKLGTDEKNDCVEGFREGRIKALISTTVIEVGMNVPAASVMVVENADRFGLAQLHQLRGRVGRGDKQAWCFLLCDGASERLKVLCSTNDGFKVAQADLETRGPGELIGSSQSGMMDLRSLGLMGDMRFVKRVEEAVKELTGDVSEQLTERARARFGRASEDIAFN